MDKHTMTVVRLCNLGSTMPSRKLSTQLRNIIPTWHDFNDHILYLIYFTIISILQVMYTNYSILHDPIPGLILKIVFQLQSSQIAEDCRAKMSTWKSTKRFSPGGCHWMFSRVNIQKRRENPENSGKQCVGHDLELVFRKHIIHIYVTI